MTETKVQTKTNESKRKPGWIGWITQRFNLRPIGEHVVYHRVAKVPWYYSDGSTLLLLTIVLFVTGMFMGLTYSPSPDTAYESVKQITEQSHLGWFVRALHYWSAGMMVVILVYHVLRHIILGGYLPPREGTWLIGVLLFFLVITTSFIGYTLRWDERAVYALRVSLNIFYKVPFIGEDLVRFVQGGWSIGANTLSRLYAVHVLFIPFSLMALIGYHVYLVLKFGTTTPLEREQAPPTAEDQIELREKETENPKTGHDFFPFMLSTSGTVAACIFMVVVVLALVKGPQELYPEANLTSTPVPVEEWWFHWYSALSALLPPWLADHFHWTFPILIFVVLVCLPFVDRGSNRGEKRRPLAIVSVIFVVIALFGLTGLRLKSPWTAWPQQELPPLPPNTNLPPSAAEGRELFASYGCYNCHSIGEQGSQFAPNLTDIHHRISAQELRAYILEPPDHAAMPAYKNRISEEDLQKIVDFVLVAQTLPRKFK